MLAGISIAYRRLAGSGLLFVALLVFFLPFASVSCGSRQVLTLSGADISLGRDVGAGSAPELGITNGHLQPDVWLLLVWLLPVAGLVLLVLPVLSARIDPRVTPVSLLAVGGLGLLRFLVLPFQVAHANDLLARSGDCPPAICSGVGQLIHVDTAPGLWAGVLVFLAIAGWGVAWTLTELREVSPDASAGQAAAPTTAPPPAGSP